VAGQIGTIVERSHTEFEQLEKDEQSASPAKSMAAMWLKRLYNSYEIMGGVMDRLLPDDDDKDLRDAYIQKARNRILAEELNLSNHRIYNWLAGRVLEGCGAGLSEAELADHIARKLEQPLQGLLKAVQSKPDFWQSFLKTYYSIPAGPDRKKKAEWLSRTVRIAGEMLEGLKPQTKGIGSKLKIAGLAIYYLRLWLSNIKSFKPALYFLVILLTLALLTLAFIGFNSLMGHIRP